MAIREERIYKIQEVEETAPQALMVLPATTGKPIKIKDVLGGNILNFITLATDLKYIKDEVLLQQEREALAPMADQLIEEERTATTNALLRFGAVLHALDFYRIYTCLDGGYDTWPDFLSARKIDARTAKFAMELFGQLTYIEGTAGLNALPAVSVMTETTIQALRETKRQSERIARTNTTSTPGYSTMTPVEKEQTYQEQLKVVVAASIPDIHLALHTPDLYLAQHMASQTPGTKIEKDTLVLEGTLTPDGDFTFKAGTIPRDLLQGGLGTGHYTLELKIDGVYRKLDDVKRELDQADMETYDPGID